MAYKIILTAPVAAPEDEVALSAGAALAVRYGGLLRVIPAFAAPAADLAYFGSALRHGADSQLVQRVLASQAQTQVALEDAAAAVAKRFGLSAQVDAAGPAFEVVKRDLAPALAMAEAAVLADLAVFSGAEIRAHAYLRDVFAETLIYGRAPCLIVNRPNPVLADAVAIAWDGGAQAGRAVRSALPVLVNAKRVVVLQNSAHLAPEHADSAPLKMYLARHGVAVIEPISIEGDNVAASLLTGAKAAGCDLLVAGAYGRPRLYELVLGGATRALVNATDAPHLLLTH